MSAYRTKNFLDKLKATPESKVLHSPTHKMISLLKRLQSELIDGYAKARHNGNARQCPFCEQFFKGGYGLGGHVRAHSDEPNYSLIRKASKYISDEISGSYE